MRWMPMDSMETLFLGEQNVIIAKSVLQNALNFFTFDDVHIETIP